MQDLWCILTQFADVDHTVLMCVCVCDMTCAGIEATESYPDPDFITTATPLPGAATEDVAVLDTGCRHTHEDLAVRGWRVQAAM